jgi:hypothetical protein
MMFPAVGCKLTLYLERGWRQARSVSEAVAQIQCSFAPPAVEFVPTLPWERRFRLDWDAGRGTGTGETRGRVCEVAGGGSEGLVNQKRDSVLQLLGAAGELGLDVDWGFWLPACFCI